MALDLTADGPVATCDACRAPLGALALVVADAEDQGPTRWPLRLSCPDPACLEKIERRFAGGPVRNDALGAYLLDLVGALDCAGVAMAEAERAG